MIRATEVPPSAENACHLVCNVASCLAGEKGTLHVLRSTYAFLGQGLSVLGAVRSLLYWSRNVLAAPERHSSGFCLQGFLP